MSVQGEENWCEQMKKQGEKQSREKAWAGGMAPGSEEPGGSGREKGGEAGGRQGQVPRDGSLLTTETKPHFHSIHVRATVLSMDMHHLHFPKARQWVLGWARSIDEN